MRFNKGFTLLELLMALAIFAAIAATVQLTLRTGIDVFRRGQGAGGVRHQLHSALDVMVRHMRQIQPLTLPEAIFLGEAESITFPTRIRVSSPGEVARYEIGWMRFTLELGAEGLNQQLVWKRQLLSGEDLPGGQTLTLLEPVESLAFQYAGYSEEELFLGENDSKNEEWVWTDEWNEERLPLGIEMTLVFIDLDTQVKERWSRVVHLPTGNRLLKDALEIISSEEGENVSEDEDAGA